MTTDTNMSASVGAAPLDAAPADYFALLKPRVMSLVVFTGAVGLFLAPGDIHPILAVVAVLCIAVGAGASGCINMWYERDVDAIMHRTRNRPIPSGRIAPRSALEFGITLAGASVMVMGVAVNWTAAALLAGAIAFYVFVYTIWLKRRTPQNIVIGGAAGAFPPMIGWAAVSGDVTLASISLFAIIFFWTPPHFWSLALYRSGDYEAAGIPMLPVVAGAEATRRQIVLYSVLMLPLCLAPWMLGVAGVLYAVGSGALSLIFMGGALRVFIRRNDDSARWMFKYSILYLFLVFALLVADRALSGVL
ncbi:MAG: heme o synthase [Alphaproteobacteria bacterium]|jgi:protoheme IX farnesyltransferase